MTSSRPLGSLVVCRLCVGHIPGSHLVHTGNSFTQLSIHPTFDNFPGVGADLERAVKLVINPEGAGPSEL